MNHTMHKFGPNETIQGIIRKYNRQDMEKHIVDLLMDQFNKLNGPDKKVPRIGELFKIPLYDFGNTPLTVKEIIEPKSLRSMPQPPEAPIIHEAHLAEVIPIMSKKEKTKDPEIEAKAIINRQQRREKKRKERGLPVHEMKISEVKKAMKEKFNITEENAPKKKAPKKVAKKETSKTKTEKAKNGTTEKAKNETLPVESVSKPPEKKKRQIPHTRKKHTKQKNLDTASEKKDNKPKRVHTRVIRNRRIR